jgi:predicted regulator of amino acid metabolism with ACT domain
MDSSNELKNLKLVIGDWKPKKGRELIRIAEQVRALKDRLGAKKLAELLGVSQSIVQDFARIAGLDSEMKDLIASSDLGLKAIRTLLSLRNREVQIAILRASAKLSFVESEINKIVSCCRRGEDVEKCVGDVLRRKPRPTYIVFSRPLPNDIVSKVKDINVVKEAMRKHGIEVDHVEIVGNRFIVLMKSGAYSKFIEKAVLYGVDEFSLVHEILRREGF